MGGMLGTAHPTVSKWNISGSKTLPDFVWAKNAADAKRQVAAMLHLPRGWSFEWEKETNGSYIFVPYNSKGKEGRGYNVVIRRAKGRPSPAKSPRLNKSIKRDPETAKAQTERRTALDRAKQKHPAATNTLRPLTNVEAIREVGLAYHVDSPAQFASMISSKGDQSMVVGVTDTGATFVGYYSLTEAYELASKLRRMRKIKFRTVTSIA